MTSLFSENKILFDADETTLSRSIKIHLHLAFKRIRKSDIQFRLIEKNDVVFRLAKDCNWEDIFRNIHAFNNIFKILIYSKGVCRAMDKYMN